MEIDLLLPIEVLHLLYNKKNEEKNIYNIKDSEALNKTITDCIIKFVAKYSTYSKISSYKTVLIKSKYLTAFREIKGKRGRGGRSMDRFISLAIEDTLSDLVEHKIDLKEYDYEGVYKIPEVVLHDFYDSSKVDEAILYTLSHYYYTFFPYNGNSPRHIKYYVSESDYQKLVDIKGRSTMYFDKLVSFSIEFYARNV